MAGPTKEQLAAIKRMKAEQASKGSGPTPEQMEAIRRMKAAKQASPQAEQGMEGVQAPQQPQEGPPSSMPSSSFSTNTSGQIAGTTDPMSMSGGQGLTEEDYAMALQQNIPQGGLEQAPEQAVSGFRTIDTEALPQEADIPTQNITLDKRGTVTENLAGEKFRVDRYSDGRTVYRGREDGTTGPDIKEGVELPKGWEAMSQEEIERFTYKASRSDEQRWREDEFKIGEKTAPQVRDIVQGQMDGAADYYLDDNQKEIYSTGKEILQLADNIEYFKKVNPALAEKMSKEMETLHEDYVRRRAKESNNYRRDQSNINYWSDRQQQDPEIQVPLANFSKEIWDGYISTLDDQNKARVTQQGFIDGGDILGMQEYIANKNLFFDPDAEAKVLKEVEQGKGDRFAEAYPEGSTAKDKLGVHWAYNHEQLRKLSNDPLLQDEQGNFVGNNPNYFIAKYGQEVMNTITMGATDYLGEAMGLLSPEDQERYRKANEYQRLKKENNKISQILYLNKDPFAGRYEDGILNTAQRWTSEFTESVAKGAAQVIAPKAGSYKTTQEEAQTLAANLMGAGVKGEQISEDAQENISDIYDPETSKIKETDWTDASSVGKTIGTTLGTAAPALAGGMAFNSAAGTTRLGRNLLRIEQIAQSARGQRLLANSSSGLARVIGQSRVARNAFRGVMGGGRYATTGVLFDTTSDEMNFSSGFAGALGEALASKLPLGQVGAKLFGRAIGELGEESAQAVNEILQASLESGDSITSEYEKRFGTANSKVKFIVYTSLMSMGMGAAGSSTVQTELDNKIKEAYGELTPEEQQQVGTILSEETQKMYSEAEKIEQEVPEAQEAQATQEQQPTQKAQPTQVQEQQNVPQEEQVAEPEKVRDTAPVQEQVQEDVQEQVQEPEKVQQKAPEAEQTQEEVTPEDVPSTEQTVAMETGTETPTMSATIQALDEKISKGEKFLKRKAITEERKQELRDSIKARSAKLASKLAQKIGVEKNIVQSEDTESIKELVGIMKESIELGAANTKQAWDYVLDSFRDVGVTEEELNNLKDVKQQILAALVDESTIGMETKPAVKKAVQKASTPQKIIDKELRDVRRGVMQGTKPFKQMKADLTQWMKSNRPEFKNLEGGQKAQAATIIKDMTPKNFLDKTRQLENVLTEGRRKKLVQDVKGRMKQLNVDQLNRANRGKFEELKEEYDMATMSQKVYNKASGDKAVFENRQKNLDRNNLTKQQKETLVGMYNANHTNQLPTDVNQLSESDLNRAFQFNERVKDRPFTTTELKNINRLGKYDISSFTTEDLETLQGRLEDIIENQKQVERNLNTKNKKFMDKRLNDLKKQAEAQGLSTKKRGTFDPTKSVKNTDKAKFGLGRFLKEGNFNILTLATKLDKGDGFVHKYIYEPLREGLRKTAELKKSYMDPVTAVTKKYSKVLKEGTHAYTKKPKTTAFSGIDSSGDTYTVDLSDGMALTIYMAAKNADNRTAMMTGGMNIKGEEHMDSWILTEKTLDEINNHVESKKHLKEVAAAMEKGIKAQGNDMAEVYSKITGGSIEEVENYVRKLVNPFSLDADNAGAVVNQMMNAKEASDIKKIFEQGFLKGRVGSSKAIMLEDAFMMYDSVSSNAARFAGQAKGIYEVTSLMSDSDFKTSFRNMYGDRAYSYIDKWAVDTIGHQRGAKEYANRIVNALQKARVTAAFAWNLAVSLKQLGSLFPIAAEVGLRNMGKGIIKTLSGQGLSTEQIENMSPEMQERFLGSFSAETGQMTDTNYMSATYFDSYGQGALNKFNQASQWDIGAMDKLTINMLYNAVASDVKNKNPELKGKELEQAIAKEAESLVDQTQPTYHNILRTENARSNSDAVRAMAMFTTAPVKAINYLGDLGIRAYHGDAKAKKKFAKAAVGVAMSATYVATIDLLRDMLKGKDDEDAAATFALKVAKNMFGAIAGVGEIIEMGTSLATGDKYYSPELMGLGVFADTYKFLEAGYKGNGEKMLEQFRKMSQFNSTTAAMSGAVSQINIFLKGQGTSVEQLAMGLIAQEAEDSGYELSPRHQRRLDKALERLERKGY